MLDKNPTLEYTGGIEMRGRDEERTAHSPEPSHYGTTITPVGAYPAQEYDHSRALC
jgi:hypothetical protein